jgi:sugar phosphate isomerase/epimerase
MPNPNPAYQGKLCYFSKALQTLMDWSKLAEATKGIGFDGLDLTVRKGGHVAPERVSEDLPRAVTAIRAEGLDVPMITTALTSASDPTARPILATAAKLGVGYFKAGYYYYQYKNVREDLAKAGQDFRSLAALAKQYGVQVGYHNHSEYVGAALWDASQFIEPLDPKVAGYYLDCCHVTGEGCAGGWKSAVHLAATRLKMVAIKDFYWKATNQGWEYTVCPLGEGRVDLKYFCKMLAEVNFQGPISLHVEYEPEGGSVEEKQANTIVNSRRDLAVLKAHLTAAYATSDK